MSASDRTAAIGAAIVAAARGAFGDDDPPPVFDHRIVLRRADERPEFWEAVRARVRQERFGGARVWRVTTLWHIDGFRVWAAGAAEERLWNARIDALTRAFRADGTLGGLVDSLAKPEGRDDDGRPRRLAREGLQAHRVGRIAHAGGATMRGALCRLTTTHTERAPSRLARR